MKIIKDDGANIWVDELRECPLCHADSTYPRQRQPYIRCYARPYEAKVICGNCGLSTDTKHGHGDSRNDAINHAIVHWNTRLAETEGGRHEKAV